MTRIDPIAPEVDDALSAGPELIEHEPAARDSRAPRVWSVPVSFWTIQASHVVVDVYPIFFATLMLTLERDFQLKDWQVAMLYGTGPVVSGLPQVFFAWLTDKLDSRFCGWCGLAVGAAAISSIGLAQSFWQLWALQIVGMLATGAYHPVSAALAGQLGERMHAAKRPRTARSWGISVFYTAGMIGGFAGTFLCTGIQSSLGLPGLLILIAPGLVLAVALWATTHKLPHRHSNHREMHATIPKSESLMRWVTVGLLFAANVLRFTVNTAIPILFAVWAENRIREDVEAATRLNGHLLAALTVGMGIFGFFAGRLAPAGREKRSMVFISLLGALFVGACGYVGQWTGTAGMLLMAGLSAMGFAAAIPTSISLAQRLLPGRTGLASGLMLGTAWGLSFVAPIFARWFLGVPITEAHALPPERINAAFAGFALMLVAAAALAAAMPSRILRAVSHPTANSSPRA